MAGPGTPGSEGPTFPPPTLPRGWVAQWDASSRKYYFVQLATGVSQWDTPTDAAPVGGGNTPASNIEHPYGGPPRDSNVELITHPDGSQTVKHPDGTMEPILPGGTRGIGDGPQGERGIGTFLMNQLGGSGGQGKQSGVGGLAGQLISGLTHSGGSGGHQSSGGSGIGGKLASQLASNLFHSSDKPSAPQSYHGGQTAQPSNSGGLAGSVMGGVSQMFGGKPASSSQNFGYSNTGASGAYTGTAPPTSYQTPTSGSSSYQSPPQQHSSTPAQPPAQTYGQQQGQQHGQQHGQSGQGHNAPYGQPTPPSFQGPPGSQSHSPSYQPPPGQQTHTPSYQSPPGQHYGQPPPSTNQPSYAAQGQHQPQGYGQPHYGGQGSYNAPYSNVPPPPPAGQSQYPSQPTYGQHQQGQGYGGHNAPY